MSAVKTNQVIFRYILRLPTYLRLTAYVLPGKIYKATLPLSAGCMYIYGFVVISYAQSCMIVGNCTAKKVDRRPSYITVRFVQNVYIDLPTKVC